ncbi:MAG: hypothetical protein MZV63_63790 [Marinilabiliales bacterium]|nr:hypothetical protein [Marinilabiliales bacterium]
MSCRDLLAEYEADEVIVENGGDIFMKLTAPVASFSSCRRLSSVREDRPAGKAGRNTAVGSAAHRAPLAIR